MCAAQTDAIRQRLLDVLPARYELGEQLGEGGMATVWTARDTRVEGGDLIALKVLHPHLLDDELVRERFRREVIAARGLRHPHIVQVHDLVEAPGCAAISMSLHQGVNMRQVLRERGKLEWAQVVEVLDALLQGLECAHQTGVIHRDIKPENIMVHPERLDEVQLMDFGLARVDALIGITTHTTTLGSVDYMAPEQLHEVTLDARADLYAVGVVCFELLTGERPFQGATPLQLARAHAEQPVPRITDDSERGVPAFADEFLAIAMAKSPAHRFATASEMRKVLRGELPLWRSMAQRRSWRCSTCEEPLVAAWAPCLVCGSTTMVTAQAGKARVYLPAAPMFRAQSAKHGRTGAVSEQQKQKVLELLRQPRWGLKQRQNAHVQKTRLQSLPVVLTQKVDVESARQLIEELHVLGLPAQCTNGMVAPELKFYQRILLNRKLIPFVGAGTLAFPFVGFFMVCILSLGWGVLQEMSMISAGSIPEHWFGLLFLLGPVLSLAMVYMCFFIWSARSMAVFDGTLAHDERASWMPEDAAMTHGALKLTHTRELYRTMLSRIFELRELLQAQDDVPDSLQDIVVQLPEFVGKEVKEVDALEREIHAASPSEIHEVMHRARDVRDHSEDSHEIEQAMRAMTHARERLELLDGAHHKLAARQHQLLELEHQLAHMIARLKQGKDLGHDGASMVRTMLDFSQEVSASQKVRHEVTHQA